MDASSDGTALRTSRERRAVEISLEDFWFEKDLAPVSIHGELGKSDLSSSLFLDSRKPAVASYKLKCVCRSHAFRMLLHVYESQHACISVALSDRGRWEWCVGVSEVSWGSCLLDSRPEVSWERCLLDRRPE